MNLNIWGDFEICISVPLSMLKVYLFVHVPLNRLVSLFYIDTIFLFLVYNMFCSQFDTN